MRQIPSSPIFHDFSVFEFRDGNLRHPSFLKRAVSVLQQDTPEIECFLRPQVARMPSDCIAQLELISWPPNRFFHREPRPSRRATRGRL